MKAQAIYTFEESEQDIINLESLTFDDIKYKSVFMDILTSLIIEELRIKELVKISVCLGFEEDEKFVIPEYFSKANGKFYFENGLLIYNGN